LPDVSTITSGMTLLAADLADQQETDRNELIALSEKIGLGASTPARGKVSVGTGTGTSAFDRIARPNLLLNGSAQIDQRGALASVDNTYGPDLWRVLMESASGWTLQQTASNLPSTGAGRKGFVLTVGATNNVKGGIWQPIRSGTVGRLRGGTASVQMRAVVSNARVGDVRVGIIQWTGTADNGGTIWADPVSAWGSAGSLPTLIAGWTFANTPANLSVPVTTHGDPLMIEGVPISSSANNLGVLIWCDDKTTTAGDTLTITDIKLEAGDYCTAVDDRPVEEERTLCREYFKLLGGVTNANVAPSYSSSTTQALGSLSWDRMYGVTPVVTVGTVTSFTVSSAAGSPACTNMTATAPSATGCTLTATVASGLTAGQGSYIYANAATGTLAVAAPW